tara:strand:- start:10530 stop:11756 length:1227 start_codon:yes stop_codon:yes gene_type:complete
LTDLQNTRRLGLWLVGARGAISTCLVYGLAGLRRGLISPTGLVTERGPVGELPLVDFDQIVVGGHDVCVRDLSKSAGELVRSGVLPAELVDNVTDEAAAFEARLRPGVLDGPDVGVADLDPASAALGAKPPRELIAQLIADWDALEQQEELTAGVVLNLASTEAMRDHRAAWDTLEGLEASLDAGDALPSSMLYAYAAISSGRPYINFTPNAGSSSPAIRELARKIGVPHAGDDGKTGETLLKTALAPMFTARGLNVMAWQGYNMLGNRDGEVLNDESHRQSKIKNKDRALRDLLGGDSNLHSGVGIDYVPSLGDWKTAWDFVHFEGFLGARMSMQITWSGSDSALAAPLGIDLVRLADFAQRAGEVGEMAHTACYFKAPLAGGTHDFHVQHRRLVEYAETHLGKLRR